MTHPHSTERRSHPDGLDPVKEVAWGARPRTVTPAALLGDRLNSRRPAPICMGRSTPGAGIGRSHSRWPAPGLRDYPPSPRPPVSSSGLPAECERVVGGSLRWRGGVTFPPPVGPPRGGSVLSPCATVRVAVACATASVTLDEPVAPHARSRRHGDLGIWPSCCRSCRLAAWSDL